jgi:hypothetical protein
MSSQPFVNSAHYIDQPTDKIPNSPAQSRAGGRQVSPLSSPSTVRRWCALVLRPLVVLAPGRRKSASTALRPPSSPTRPGSSIPTDTRSEGLLTTGKHGRRWIGKIFKKSTDSLRGTSFVQHPRAGDSDG